MVEKLVNIHVLHGIVTKIVFSQQIIQVHVAVDPDNGCVSMDEVMKYVDSTVNRNGKKVLKLLSIEVKDIGNTIVISLAKGDFDELAQAWKYYLGDIITSPPRMW